MRHDPCKARLAPPNTQVKTALGANVVPYPAFSTHEKIYALLKDELVDFENYIKEIANYMDKK